MSATFDHLKKILDEKGTISTTELEAAEKEHGALTEQEKIDLEAAKYEKERSGAATITMEQYLEASKLLDTAAEGSEEYKKALALVEKYEAGM
jgi:hypothetical protein